MTGKPFGVAHHKAALSAAIGVLVPAPCLGCGDPHTRWCASCAIWTESAVPRCGSMIGSVPTVSRWPYQGPARSLIRATKFSGRHDGLTLWGQGLAQALLMLPQQPSRVTIVPVPSASRANAGRGRALVEVACRRMLEFSPQLRAQIVPALVKTEATHQARRHRAGRVSAAQHAVRLRGNAELRGHHVVVVDDVLTTGATMAASLRLIAGAGPASLAAITCAHVSSV